ncbi:phage tail protein [Marinisporobacter balticus]|uniref:Microcystin-dependent protein n=1 Tax=Marinisporobacter balticus TaxID=2018667 RepID=A0A4R2KHN2_9FIRM|nr:tail fiber protein [Marinisporobacter balticus]TCO70006.1 microcystin-dependent protein [Marinisporobacter balticus]
MSEPFIGEIKIFGFNFAPRDWAFCDGQLLPISQNTALFSILSTMYGGNGRTDFGLPNLMGRVPIHPGTAPGLQTRRLGQMIGCESVTLTEEQIPSHTHQAIAMRSGDKDTNPQNKLLGTGGGYGYVTTDDHPVNMSSAALQTTGNSHPHENRQPFLAMNFCIALTGIYPQRS